MCERERAREREREREREKSLLPLLTLLTRLTLRIRQHGFQGVTLGPRTLRTDVALTSLLALAHDRLRVADN